MLRKGVAKRRAGNLDQPIEGLPMATALRPDFVVLDIAMPLLNGLDAER
jgi:CheY-like chemotaxis protein